MSPESIRWNPFPDSTGVESGIQFIESGIQITQYCYYQTRFIVRLREVRWTAGIYWTPRLISSSHFFPQTSIGRKNGES